MSSSGNDRPVATVPKNPSLAESLNAATRPIHARLNKNIVSHLPQAIPPQASDPSTYVTGLLHIAPIYLTFETLWKQIIERGPHCIEPENEATEETKKTGHLPTPADCGGTGSEPELTHVCSRMHSILGALHLPGLLRASRIQQDIEVLTGWSREAVETQIHDISSEGPLGDFVDHVKEAVEARPHVIIAYSYILYMALFAGGRFMRAAFERAGDEFWFQVPSPVKPSMKHCVRHSRDACTALKDILESDRASRSTMPGNDAKRAGQRPRCRSCESIQEAESKNAACPPTSEQRSDSHMSLQFFRFSTPEDGEDLKREFKQCLLKVQDQVLPHERSDIMEEGLAIFEEMLKVVEQLDRVCNNASSTASDSEADSGVDENEEGDITGPENEGRLTRARDSFIIAKERIKRKVKDKTESWSDTAPSVVGETKTIHIIDPETRGIEGAKSKNGNMCDGTTDGSLITPKDSTLILSDMAKALAVGFGVVIMLLVAGPGRAFWERFV